jgi:hypothetical protein
MTNDTSSPVPRLLETAEKVEALALQLYREWGAFAEEPAKQIFLAADSLRAKAQKLNREALERCGLAES